MCFCQLLLHMIFFYFLRMKSLMYSCNIRLVGNMKVIGHLSLGCTIFLELQSDFLAFLSTFNGPDFFLFLIRCKCWKNINVLVATIKFSQWAKACQTNATWRCQAIICQLLSSKKNDDDIWGIRVANSDLIPTIRYGMQKLPIYIPAIECMIIHTYML